MKNFVLVTFFIAITSAATAAEYQSDWDYKNFYEAINTCRSAVVYPAALDYEAKGLSSRQTKETLRNEMIAITPVSESIASEVCYCAVNAYAKDKSNADFIKNWESVADYFEAPLCKEKMASAIKLMPQNAKSLRLN